LGKKYPSQQDVEFLNDFQTRIWCSYRSGFPPIIKQTYTNDGGWGCMLRSGQMLLANCMLIHELGRDWRISMIENGDWQRYSQIVTRFLDSPTAPFSIHKIALQGMQFDKQVGEWFGPGTISQVLKYTCIYLEFWYIVIPIHSSEFMCPKMEWYFWMKFKMNSKNIMNLNKKDYCYLLMFD
jgi:hypothetical protein